VWQHHRAIRNHLPAAAPALPPRNHREANGPLCYLTRNKFAHYSAPEEILGEQATVLPDHPCSLAGKRKHEKARPNEQGIKQVNDPNYFKQPRAGAKLKKSFHVLLCGGVVGLRGRGWLASGGGRLY